MQITQRVQGDKATLVLVGRFDFNTHKDFRNGYETALGIQAVHTLEIDMGGVEYLDSSALGMLLLLKEHAASRNVSLSITHTSGTVRQILEIANFNKLFAIS